MLKMKTVCQTIDLAHARQISLFKSNFAISSVSPNFSGDGAPFVSVTSNKDDISAQPRQSQCSLLADAVCATRDDGKLPL